MPSKTSKRRAKPPSPWKVAPGCSEAALRAIAAELAVELRAGDRVFLEGPLGAGKTTFARALLEALGVQQPPEGSPTFALAHEYESPKGEVIHVDLYRIKSASEIDDAGISAAFWEREAVVIAEWVSLWPELWRQVEESAAREGHALWSVSLEIESEISRRITIIRGPTP